MLHTPAGDRWRKGLRRPDGKYAERSEKLEWELAFWKKRMENGLPPRDTYADAVFNGLMELAEGLEIQSGIEIGPGWGNYTLPLSRRLERLTCVDFSEDNLACLALRTAQEGNPIICCHSAWEDANVEPHDLVFAYNCFYMVEEPELFLSKVNASATKLCAVGMNCPPELPWQKDLLSAGFPALYMKQGCVELSAILREIGIHARLVNIPNERVFSYKNKEALLKRLKRAVAAEIADEILLSIAMPYHEEMPDGSLICRYQFNSQLLVWRPQ